MRVLAFIPARGGSKGILKKNLASLLGKPLIQYTLDLVRELGDAVIPFVSTDSQEIFDYCHTQGFDMEYQRPWHLAQDDSLMVDTVLDGVDWYQNKTNTIVDAVLILQPTNPIRYAKELYEALLRFEALQLDSMISVVPIDDHPYESLDVADEGHWTYLRKPDSTVYGRQEYPSDFYHIDGSFYFVKTRFLLEHRKLIVEGITQLFYLKDRRRVDIDTPEDLIIAEALMQYYKSKENIQ